MTCRFHLFRSLIFFNKVWHFQLHNSYTSFVEFTLTSLSMLLYRELILLVGIFPAVPPWHPSSSYLVSLEPDPQVGWNQLYWEPDSSEGGQEGPTKRSRLWYVPSIGVALAAFFPGRRLGLGESAWALVGPKAGSYHLWVMGTWPTSFEPPFLFIKWGGVAWWYLPVELSSEAPCVQSQHKVTAAWVVAVMITGSSSLWCVPGIMPHIMPAVT